VQEWGEIYITENASGWKKTHWLNKGRDIKSSTYGSATFCTATSCRLNKFNLQSAVDQQYWVGIATHDERDYVGCSIPYTSNYVSVNGSYSWNSFSYGTLWLGPYNISAGQTQSLRVELDLLKSPLKNDWSIIAWGTTGQISIAHSDGYLTDAWPVQGLVANQNPSGTPIVEPTPAPAPVTNSMDTFVKSYPPTSTGCGAYSSRGVIQSVSGVYTYYRMYGHNCTGYTLALRVGWQTSSFLKMKEMTSAHKGTCVNKTTDATYTYCDYQVKTGTNL
jgi:hypothetical protein